MAKKTSVRKLELGTTRATEYFELRIFDTGLAEMHFFFQVYTWAPNINPIGDPPLHYVFDRPAIARVDYLNYAVWRRQYPDAPTAFRSIGQYFGRVKWQQNNDPQGGSFHFLVVEYPPKPDNRLMIPGGTWIKKKKTPKE